MTDGDVAAADPATLDTPSGEGPIASRRIVVAVAATLVVIVSVILLARLLAPIRFVFDDWMFITSRHRLTADSVLRSHNGHPVMLPSLVYMLGFHTVGLHDLWFYRFALIVAHLALCGVLAARVWRRHGALPAGATWLLVCFMGAGATNIVWPFQISLVGSVLFFVLAVDALDRLRRTGRRRDAIVVAAMVTGSLMCSAVGLAALVAIGIVVLAGTHRRRDWWVPAIPLALFALWWVPYHEPANGSSDITAISRALWQSAQAAGAVILAGNDTLGGALVVAVFVAAAVALTRRKVAVHHTVGLLFVATFWLLTASTRALQLLMLGLSSPPRYQYVAVVALLLAVSDLTPRLPSPSRRVAAGALCAIVAVASVWAGHADLIRERDLFASFGERTAAQLTVIDAHPDSFPDDMVLVGLLGQTLASVGAYLQASQHLDSAGGFTSAELLELPDGGAHPAEDLMLPLLEVNGLPPDGCTPNGPVVQTVTLDAGATLDIAAIDATTLVASRWMPPAAEGAGVHAMVDGVWTITAPDDELTPPWRLTFDRSVQPLDCD